MKKVILSLLLAAGTMTTYAAAGVVNGEFTVNADGKKVLFSQGNLQATTTDLGANWTWSFAENQWDFIGNAAANNAINGNGVVTSNGAVDLFGWSTAANYFGINNSDNSSKYSGDFVDWGKMIGAGWYTMSKDEWVYVLNTRTGDKASTVNENANIRYAKATVNSYKGIILFPDGGTFAASEFTTVTSLNKGNAAFTATTCTADQWTALEAKGCVFLPITGYRLSEVVYSVNVDGFYWSSTPVDEFNAYLVVFGSDFFNPQGQTTRESGQPVRLVHEPAKVGDKFKTASGEDMLQYEVTAITPDLKVKVTQSGHTLKEGTDLVIPASVKYIGQTFAVTEIESSPKFGNAKTISLPNSLSKAVSWFVGELGSLEAFIVAEDNPIYTVVNGVLYTKDKKTLYRCPAKKAFTSADFQPETKYLAGYAFYKNTEIGELVIPNTVVSTETGTFSQSSLTSVFIPSSITSMANGVFSSCASLTSVEFENSALMSIAWDSFNNSKIMNDQGDLKIIDSIAVKYTGTADTVAIPEGIVNVAYSFIFVEYSSAQNLTTVILPSTMKTVYYQFLSFNSVSTKFPKLEKIICKAQNVPNVMGSKLEINSAKDVTLVVPCGKGADYTAATNFSNPFTIVEEGFVYDVTLKQTEGGIIAYTKMEECNGIELTATPDEGYEFVKWNDDDTDAKRTVAVNSDMEFSATFALQKFNVTIVAENGSVTAKDTTEAPVDLSQPIEYGTKLILTATPDEGYEFDSWTNYDPATGLTVTVDVTVTANFKEKTSGIENVQSDLQCTKVIRNGQLLIIRDVKVFNAIGQEVK